MHKCTTSFGAFQLFTKPEQALLKNYMHMWSVVKMLILFSAHMEWPHQWHTAEPTRPGQWTKVQLLCKHIHYIRLQSLSSSQIINA